MGGFQTLREGATSEDEGVSKLQSMRTKLALIFAVLKFGQLSNNEQEVDDGEVRQTLCGDVYLRQI